MSEFGHFALCLGWFLALVGTLCGWLCGLKRFWSPGRVETLRRVTMCVALVLLLSTAALGYCFVTNEYTLQYVWQYSNRDMPWIYKITAIWGGMDGSMLLWCCLLSMFCCTVAFVAAGFPRLLSPWLFGYLNSTTLFFTTVTVFFTNPFRYVQTAMPGHEPFIPPDGNGLNPLLQNPYMAIHPPMLYLGFTGLAVPYAFCMAALSSGQLSNDWLRLTRRWSLIAWSFLTAGIVLGGHWAYLELGWGGFWAWDPVENASFLPWLATTAFLHSVMVQERKGMLKVWNILLITLAYLLTVFGTFLTRSGIVQSVHAFASTDVGWVFLLYLTLIAVVAVGLVAFRWGTLKPERGIESIFSREAAFLLNNLVLLSICFAVLWGVMFPVFSEAFTGVKQTVGIPFFNAVNVPLFLALIFLMGIGPVIAWRSSTVAQLKRLFLWPFVGAFVVGVALVWAGITSFYPVLSYSLCFFALMTILGELSRGLKAQGGVTEGVAWAPSSIATLLKRHRVKYGGHLIHFGVLVMTVAITASMAHKIEKEFVLAPGERFNVGRFSIELLEFHQEARSNHDALQAHANIRLIKDDSIVATLEPELRVYRQNRFDQRNTENTTEVALSMGAREDVYLVLAGVDETGTRASMKVFINPLQVWLWYGAIIMVLGGFIVAIPVPKTAASRVPASVAASRSHV